MKNARAALGRQQHLRRVVLAGLQGVALLIVALSLYVRTLPPTPAPLPAPQDAEASWWGLWPATYPPPGVVWLGAGAVAVLISAAWLAPQRPNVDEDRPAGLLYTGLVAVALALLLAFFRWPVAHTRWGDAYLLANAIAWPDPALRLTHSWQAPLDLWLHSQFWLAGHEHSGWEDAFPVYRLLSPLAGALYLAALLGLSRETTLAPGWLTFGLLSTLGLLQLFFGYVENYSFAAAGVLGYLWLGWRVLQGTTPLWLAASALAITNGLHPSTVVLAPSLLYLGWRRGRTDRLSLWGVVAAIGLPMLVVAGGVVVLMEAGGHGLIALMTTDRPGGGDARWFVPLWQTSTRWEQYTLFSWPHLRDWLNGQLLVAPVVWPSVIWLLGIGAWRQKTRDWPLSPHHGNFLASAAGCYLLFTWLWNPDYGGQRDWDLFSLAALPATLTLIWLLPRCLDAPGLFWRGVAPLIAVQGLKTAAWIYQNTLPWSWPP